MANPASNCMFKVNIRKTITRYEIYLKLRFKTQELSIASLLLALSRQMPAGKAVENEYLFSNNWFEKIIQKTRFCKCLYKAVVKIGNWKLKF